MSALLKLFSIEVEHSFFSDRLLRHIRLTPLQDTGDFMERAGLLIRRAPNGIALYGASDSASVLQLQLADEGGSRLLQFAAFVEDAGFLGYTDSLGAERTGIVCFDGENSVAEGERLRLHRERYAAAEDVQWVQPARSTALKKSEMPVGTFSVRRPEFLVKVRLPLSRLHTPASESPLYVIRLRSRLTFWTYYLLGTVAERKVDIVDIDGAIEFEPLGQVALSDGRSTLAFRSRSAIPLQQRSTRRFQLREAAGGKVLVRRLPIAGAGQLNRQLIGDQFVSISEMYVNA